MRILIVEDVAEIRDILWEALSEASHSVDLAAAYPKGSEMLTDCLQPGGKPWDLLLTDLDLPGGSGWDLALHARALGTPVPLCLGHPTQMAMAARGIPYLRKPFTLSGVLDQVTAATAQPMPSGDNPGGRLATSTDS